MPSSRLAACALFFVLAFTVGACGSGDDAGSEAGSGPPGAGHGGDEGQDPAVAGPLGFVAPVLAGGTLDTATLAGEPVVLWFWAPWCVTCRGEAPHVSAVAAEYGAQVHVLGVAGRGAVSEMERFVDDTGVGGFDHLVDGDGVVWTDFGVSSQPAFAFIGAGGEVEVVVGALGRSALTDRVEALLAS